MKVPESLHTNFLGLVEMGSKSLVLGILAGITQFVQGYLSSPVKKKVEIVKEVGQEKQEPSFQDQLSDGMQMNIKYVMPVFITLIAWKISAAVALYWIVSNMFTIVQEWYIRRQLKQNSI